MAPSILCYRCAGLKFVKVRALVVMVASKIPLITTTTTIILPHVIVSIFSHTNWTFAVELLVSGSK